MDQGNYYAYDPTLVAQPWSVMGERTPLTLAPPSTATPYNTYAHQFLHPVRQLHGFNASSVGTPDARATDTSWRAEPGSADDPTVEAFLSRTLYMKNLPSSMTEESLTQLCETHAGKPRRITLQSQKRIGFIEFHDIRDAEKARGTLKGMLLPDATKTLEVQYSRVRDDKTQKDGSIVKATLYVRPVTSDRCFVDPNTAEDYKALFSAHGDVKKVNINRKRQAEKFIEFYDLRASEAAHNALNGHIFNGVQLEVQYAHVASKTLNRESKIHDVLVSKFKSKNACLAVSEGSSGGYNPIRANQISRMDSANCRPGHPYDMHHVNVGSQPGSWNAQFYQHYALAFQQQLLMNAAFPASSGGSEATYAQRTIAPGAKSTFSGKSPYPKRGYPSSLNPKRESPSATGANQIPLKGKTGPNHQGKPGMLGVNPAIYSNIGA